MFYFELFSSKITTISTEISNIKWLVSSFEDLSKNELYDIMYLRQLVFIVEQDCPYIDADYKDQKSYHVLGYLDKELVAHTRLVKPGVSYEEPSIGRVVTAPSVRGTGIGKVLMEQSVTALEKLFKTSACRISAQSYLIPFYSYYGFEVCSEEYLEDGLPHHQMLRK